MQLLLLLLLLLFAGVNCDDGDNVTLCVRPCTSSIASTSHLEASNPAADVPLPCVHKLQMPTSQHAQGVVYMLSHTAALRYQAAANRRRIRRVRSKIGRKIRRALSSIQAQEQGAARISCSPPLAHSLLRRTATQPRV
jgi:hypothetical protein